MAVSILVMDTKPLSYDEALYFVAAIEEEGKFIVGIERFIRCSDGNVPDIDGIADFSKLEAGETQGSYASAKAYFENYGTNLHEVFVISLAQETGWP